MARKCESCGKELKAFEGLYSEGDYCGECWELISIISI